MANPSNPVVASGNVPPPVLNLPFCEVRQDGIYLTVSGLQFMQLLWASIQGGGGLVGQAMSNLLSSGMTIGTVTGLQAALNRTTDPLTLSPLAVTRRDMEQAILLAERPQIPPSIQVMLDGLGMAQGDLLYRDANQWQVLLPGAAGQFLQTQGAGANPAWASQAFINPPVSTFAGLPASPHDGDRAFITDSTISAPLNFGAIPAGGGSNHVPVYWDGGSSNWRIG